MQLDEIAFPVLLAWRLHKLQLLGQFNPLVMVKRAVAFSFTGGRSQAKNGGKRRAAIRPPRWQPSSQPSSVRRPSRAGKQEETASFLEGYADFLRAHLNEWAVTTKGSLVPGVPRHFVRLNPAKPGEAADPGQVDKRNATIVNQSPGSRTRTPPARSSMRASCSLFVTEFSPLTTR